MTSTLRQIGEHGLIARLRARVPPAPGWVALGIGDDAAVIVPPRGEVEVVTTDSLVEGVHFRRDWTRAEDIGHKALAVNLSDLAAMGAAPRAVLLSLALPADLETSVFDGMIDGFLALAAASNAPLVGGNLTASPGPMVIDVTAIGAVRRRRVLTRAGGRPNDELYVTGAVGGAAAGLAMRQRGGSAADDLARRLSAEHVLARYERPAPQLRCGIAVARNRAASACVDLSDGLADAIAQLAESSGTGAIVQSHEVPVDAGARAWAEHAGSDPIGFALAGGEDYELLFAVPPRRRRAFLAAVGTAPGVTATRIGKLTAESGLWLDDGKGRTPIGAGFRHF